MGQWTGRDAGFLRQALRLTVRDFAEDLGVSPRTISKWESAGAARTPRPELQAALDTALAQATEEERERLAIAQQNPRRYFDSAAVAILRRQLDACKAADQAMGPAGTLPGVLSLLTFIDEQARDVTPEIRCLLRPFLNVLAALAPRWSRRSRPACARPM